jgi:hypothetical protein
MIRITSKQHNFRRCGKAHPKGPVEYPDGTFTPEQITALRKERKLTVEIVPEEKEPATGRIGEPAKEKEDGQAGGTVVDGETLDPALETLRAGSPSGLEAEQTKKTKQTRRTR